MENPIVIDRSTYKFMRYVYFHSEVRLCKLYKKFDHNDSRDVVVPSIMALCGAKFGAYRRPDGSLTFDYSNISFDGSFGLTPEGNKYVEDHMTSSFQWMSTTLISFSARILSLISLIASFSNEIFVHIVT